MNPIARSVAFGILAIGLAGADAHADVIATWTFENSVPAEAGPYSPEVGSGSALGFHSNGSTYSNPVGNGSAESFSSTTWAVGDYYQFQVGTLGLGGVSLSGVAELDNPQAPATKTAAEVPNALIRLILPLFVSF